MDRIQISIIKQALDYEDLLSEWEAGFINSLAERENDYELSDKQNEVLNRIGNKIATER